MQLRPSRDPWLFAVVFFLLAAGLAPGAMGQSHVSAADAEEAAEARGKRDPMDDLGSLKPEDGVWLKDEDGREYILRKVPNDPKKVKWINDEKIRYGYWYTFTVAKKDDDHVWVKVFKPAEVPETESAEAQAQKEAEELAALAATFTTTVGESDRLLFTRFDEGLPKQEMWRNGFGVADMNGDGHLDIVHGPPRKGALVPRIFLGDSRGNWKLWREARYPRAPYDYGDATAADFNGDGLMDLALGFHLRGLLVLVQESPGVFQTWSKGVDLELPGQGSDASGFSTREVEAADWNGDGRPDLIALGEGPRPGGTKDGKRTGLVSTLSYGGVVYLNNGDGTWSRLDQGLKTNGIFGDSLALGDFDGDGRLDFVTSSNVLDRRDVLNLGEKGGTDWQPTELELFRPYTYIQSVTAADFNGDGRDDMAFGFANWQKKIWRTGVDVFLSKGKEGWERVTITADEGRESVWAIESGDLDGDGHQDLVASTANGNVWIFLGDGAGAFARESSPELRSPVGCRGYDLNLVDLDGDGRDEILGSFASEGSVLPLPEFPEACRNGGELAVWRPAPNLQQVQLDRAP